jgi:hypothetical protein
MEKRKYRRVVFHAVASLQGAQTNCSGTVDNLSMKGMFILTKEHVECGIPLEICVVLSGASSVLSIKATGIALRQTDKGVAIKFQEMDIDSFIYLRNVVAMNSDDADACYEEYCHAIMSK